MLEELKQDLLNSIQEGIDNQRIINMISVIDKLLTNPPNREALERKLESMIEYHMTDAYECYWREQE